mmetsp:Transcript_17219/g.32590  ORF Transcript_17219/g.32590 Transcript_17219/m.32590 type:complete len:84 (+) Transcript_17219:361-612(+)
MRVIVSKIAPLINSLSRKAMNNVIKIRKFNSIPVVKLRIPSNTANATPARSKVLVGFGVRLTIDRPVIFSNKTGVTILVPWAG